MSNEPLIVEKLTETDLETHAVWRFVHGQSGDETRLRPVTRVPVSDLTGKLVAVRVTLANDDKLWALLGNIDLSNDRLTKHFVALSVRRGGRWFHLARYHDADYAERGPEALASFLGLRVEQVFPILYDLGSCVRSGSAARAGAILAEPDERLSRAELMALAVP